MGQAKKKQRDCPAVGRVITPAECGENRASRYACPATCPHNPWSPANYERALEIEDGLTAKMMERLARQTLGDRDMERAILQASEAGVTSMQALFVNRFFRRRDEQGRSFYDRWIAERLEGLTNDERFLLQCQSRMRVAVVEVQCVRNAEQCQVVDLLQSDAPPFLIQDRSLAGSAVRFAALVGWVFPSLCYSRIHGAAAPIPEVIEMDPDEIVRETAMHLGGPAENRLLTEWLADHFDDVVDSLTATTDALRWKMIESMDVRDSKATYRLRISPEELARQLAKCPSVVEGELSDSELAEGGVEAFEWLDEPRPLETKQMPLPLAEPPPPIEGRPLLGRVIVAREQVRIEAGATARYQALRAQFEKLLGRQIEFQAERVEDVGRMYLDKEHPPDFTLVPPRFLEQTPRVLMQVSLVEGELPAMTPDEASARLAGQHLKRFLDQPVPALNHKTPRQAAADPSLRASLVQLMKRHVAHHDEANLRTGRADDINWVIRELGLTEIDFEPPPQRRVPAPRREPSSRTQTGDADRPFSPPPPPKGEMSPSEVQQRMDWIMGEFPEVEVALNLLEQTDPDLMDWLYSLADEDWTKEEQVLFLGTATTVYLVFDPDGSWTGHVNVERMQKALDREMDEFVSVIETGQPQSFDKFLTSSRQPALAVTIAAFLLKAMQVTEPRRSVNVKAAGYMVVVLKVLMDELDQAIHGK